MDDERKEGEDSRRAVERLPLSAMVTYRLDGQEYGNLAADISPDGIFIRTFVPPDVGTRLDMTVELPREMGGLRVDLEGEVVRVVDGEDPRQNGMGVHFTAIHATDPDTVRYLVTKIFRFEVLQRSRSVLDSED
jgi:hypothetical protein